MLLVVLLFWQEDVDRYNSLCICHINTYINIFPKNVYINMTDVMMARRAVDCTKQRVEYMLI